MIATAVGDVLPIAVTVAISPVAIISGVVLQLSEHGRAKAVLFAVGWIISLLVVTGIAVAVTDVAEEDSPAATDDGVKIFTLILGVIFLGLAVVAWRKRPAPGEPASEAKLLARVTAMSGLSVLGLGLIEAVAIVKNVPLSFGAGARIAEDTGNRSEAWIVLVIFVLIASLGILLPLLIAIVGGHRLDPALNNFREWLEANISPITIITCLVVGVYFIGTGLAVFS